LDATSKTYFAQKYTTGTSGADLYIYFYERGHSILRAGGFFGFISSNKFMRAGYGEKLRNYLATQVTLREIIDFGELPVFQGAATFPPIVLTKNEKSNDKLNFCYAPIKS
jgi:type II restriction/modification system DNA methylase subunit YeeA